MAFTKGNERNRGQAAPSSRQPTALPRPTSAPRTVAEAIGLGSTGVGFSNRPLEVLRRTDERDPRDWEAVHPPALAPRSPRAAQLYKQDTENAAVRAQQREAVSSMYDNMAARQKTAEARAAREAADRQETRKNLTADEWIKMSPLQQAGVQANADLADAVRRDVEGQYKHHATTQQIEDYQNRVRELFGDLGVGYKGIEYAPNTVAYLNERGFTKEDLAGKTLDDFLSGDVLATRDVVDRLDQKPTGADVFKVQDGELSFAQRLAKGQMAYQEKLAASLKHGDQLLANMTGRGTNDAATRTYGALEGDAATKPSTIRPETAGQLDKYMEALARSDLDINESLSTIKLDLEQRGASEEEQSQVYQELLNRTRQGLTGEGGWFDGIDFKMRTPSEVAQALGAPVLKRSGSER